MVIVLLRQHNLLCNLAADCVLKIQKQITIANSSKTDNTDRNTLMFMMLMVVIISYLVEHNYVPVFRLHILHILLLWGTFIITIKADNYNDDVLLLSRIFVKMIQADDDDWVTCVQLGNWMSRWMRASNQNVGLLSM